LPELWQRIHGYSFVDTVYMYKEASCINRQVPLLLLRQCKHKQHCLEAQLECWAKVNNTDSTVFSYQNQQVAIVDDQLQPFNQRSWVKTITL